MILLYAVQCAYISCIVMFTRHYIFEYKFNNVVF